MFNHFYNIDLDFLFEEEGALSGFVSRVMRNAKPVNGYSSFYLYSSIGEPEFEMVVDVDEEKQEIDLAAMETHVCGDNVWEMAVASDITDKQAHKMTRSVVFRDRETGEGLVPVGLRFSDVIPSFMPDDVIKMQIVAFAESVELYENEAKYFEACERDENGNVVEPGNGVIFPTGLVHNHTESPDDENDDNSITDLYVILRSEIKRVEKGGMTNWWKTEDEEEQSFHTLYSVTVGTLYGDLDIIIGVRQLDEEKKKLLKEGSVIYGVFTLSGDVAIDEFESGALYNGECDLRLIRQGLVNGEIDRIFSALDENVILDFPSNRVNAKGKAQVMEQIRKYHASHDRFITALANASVVFDDESVDYESTRRCLAISYGGEVAEHLVFIEVNENGKITQLQIVSALGFEVRIDKPEYEYDDDIYGSDGFGELN